MKYIKITTRILLIIVILSSCAKELVFVENEIELSNYIYDKEEQSLYYTQETAGLLPGFIDSHFLKYRLKTLTIAGPINGTDLLCIREMAGADVYGNETKGILDSLNLSQCNFTEGGHAYYIERNESGENISEMYMENACVGECAFLNCANVKYILLPENIISFGYRAFEGCKNLLDINIPSKLQTFDKRGFMNCPYLWGWKSYKDENGKWIDYKQRHIIPNRIKDIPDSLFYGCTALGIIRFPATIKRIGRAAFCGCRDVEFEWDSNNLQEFGSYAFSGCHYLKSFAIPSSMDSIPSFSFAGCDSLSSITIPENVTTIGNNAFEGCNQLESITIPNNVISIGENAFASAGLSGSLQLPSSLLHISTGAFSKTKISSLVVNSNISCDARNYYWSEGDFGYCNQLKRIVVNEPVSFFELRFVHCDSLSEIVLPKSLKRFGSNHNELYGSLQFGYNFYKCPSLTIIELPNGLDSIGSAVFAYTDIEEVVIPHSVTYIGNDSFENCSKLVNVQIPQSVSYIDVAAFSGCSSLQAVTLPNSIKFIGASAFRNCSVLKSISLSKELKELEYGTFYGCKELERIEIPGNIERIAPEVFVGCSKLQEVFFFAPVKTIENNAFSHCISLQEIHLPNSLKLLDYGAFYNCSSLRSVVLPQSLDSIGNNAFLDCSSLSKVTNYSVKPQNISSSVFKGVQLSTSTLTVPNGTSALYKASDVWNMFGAIVECSGYMSPISDLFYAK